MTTATIKYERAVRSVYRPPEKLSASQWAEKHLILSERVTAYPGPIRWDLTPYLRAIIDKFSDTRVETVTLCSASQVGKTTFQAATLGYEIDQDPGPSLFVMPNADLARSFSETRLQPLFSDCPSIARHIPMSRSRTGPKIAAFKKMEMHFDRMTLALVGANSPAQLASRPIRRLRLDEIDKFPGASEREAAAADLARERTKTYWNRKVLQTSTPTITTGEIWRQFMAGDQSYYLVPCPYCRQSQRLRFEQVHWPPEARTKDGWNIEQVSRETHYLCEHCGEPILDRHKPAMLRDGYWESTAPNPNHASFQISSLYSILGNLKFGDVAVKFLQSKDSVDSLRNFVNSWLGEPWEERGEAADEQKILSHKLEYKAGTCPSDPWAVVITADVQKDEIYFVVRAWGENETSWLVRYGIVRDFEALRQISFDRYHVINANGEIGDIFPTHGLIDSGDRTDEIYRFCEANNWTPLKGRAGAQQLYPVRESREIGRLVTINVDYFKEQLQQRIKMSTDVPGAWCLHAETEFTYASHLASEALIEESDRWGRTKRTWKLVGRANHWLDCEIYQLAAAAWMGMRYWEPPSAKPKAKKTNEERPDPHRRDGRQWHER